MVGGGKCLEGCGCCFHEQFADWGEILLLCWCLRDQISGVEAPTRGRDTGCGGVDEVYSLDGDFGLGEHGLERMHFGDSRERMAMIAMG